MAGEPTEEEKRKLSGDSYNEFMKYFDQNKIFFEKSLAVDLENFAKKLRECWTDLFTETTLQAFLDESAARVSETGWNAL